MPKLTMLVGLAGSGKSYLANEIRAQYGAEVFEGIVADAEACTRMIECLRAGTPCVVEELQFCVPDIRDVFEEQVKKTVPGVDFEWIFFKKDFDSATWNASRLIAIPFRAGTTRSCVRGATSPRTRAVP